MADCSHRTSATMLNEVIHQLRCAQAGGTKTIMNNLVNEVNNAQRALTLHPQLGRQKANQFSLDRKGGYTGCTKRNYATRTTR